MCYLLKLLLLLLLLFDLFSAMYTTTYIEYVQEINSKVVFSKSFSISNIEKLHKYSFEVVKFSKWSF